jgi:hypothetical protein
MVGKATSLGFGEVQGRADKKVGLKAQSVWDLSMEMYARWYLSPKSLLLQYPPPPSCHKDTTNNAF